MLLMRDPLFRQRSGLREFGISLDDVDDPEAARLELIEQLGKSKCRLLVDVVQQKDAPAARFDAAHGAPHDFLVADMSPVIREKN